MLRSTLALSLILTFGLALRADDKKDEKKPEPAAPQKEFTQVPERLPVVEKGKPAPAPAESPLAKILKTGDLPNWIWGADENKAYYVRTTFPGGSKSARMLATCDNRMTVWINGQQVAESGEWQTPVEMDVQKFLKDGDNEVVAQIRNEGSAAGFLFKLALTGADGQTRTVVSDASWKVSEEKDARELAAVKVLHKHGEGPWGDLLSKFDPSAPRNQFEVLPGFQVERLFTVPRDKLGSWVSLCVDNKGRILASDEGDKGLCRITPAPSGSSESTKVERLDVKISSAQGMLWAFDSLYLSVNGGPGSGIYRLKDTDGDDQFDEVKKLREIPGGGEHGPHSIRLSPDGQSIYIVCGNYTSLPNDFTSHLPSNWGEDLLLPRQWDANGHAVGLLAPGGWIARTDPEGKTWDVVSSGYRNTYDMAFNADGELFAYDSDMEWDMGMPWYRPTRVLHATLGSEFGWRSGSGCWPSYFADSLPAAVNIGPGSPVGVTFGYGAKFPARYQKALLICDWTFGTMYAIHLQPDGSTYKGVREEFLSRTPLPLTDAVVGADGALYVSVGGRGTQSELFRVTYAGKEPVDPVDPHDVAGAELRKLRHELEARQQKSDNPADVIAFVWPHLGHPDRFIRHAARVALENQDPNAWPWGQIYEEQDPDRLITAAIAMTHQVDKALQPQLLHALGKLDFAKLTEPQQLGALRAVELAFIRMGQPTPEIAAVAAARLDQFYPSSSDLVNRELCNLLVYLKSPTVIAKTLALLAQPREVTPDEMGDVLARNSGYGGTIKEMLANRPDVQKLHYVFALRNLSTGWTLEQRKQYFDYLAEARKKKGGASYQGFLRNIDREAFENAPEPERLAIEASGARQPYKAPELPKPAGPGKDWTLDEVVALTKDKLKGRDFKNGQKMFAATRCIICHRFAGDGGATGPDLTQAAGRFSPKDLTEAIVDPGKVVSDQYKAHILLTRDGKSHTGRLLASTPDAVTLLTDPEDPTKQVTVPRDNVDELEPSQTSLMPRDLLKPLNEDEVLDLLAYILSRGNQGDTLFRK